MAYINFTCPHCAFSKQLPVSTEGMQGNCPSCKAVVTISDNPPANSSVLQQQPLQQPLQQQYPQQQLLQHPPTTWSTPTLSNEPPQNTDERQKSLANAVLQRAQDKYTSKPRRPSRGDTVLWLGILGFFLFPILCPIAWILGSGDLKKMRKGVMEDHSAGTTRIGCALGAIGTIFLIITITIIIFLIIYAASDTVPWWMAGVLS